MSGVNYRQLHDDLISAICRELIKIQNLPEKTVEDTWVEGTLCSVLSRMCALHKVRPDMQKMDVLTRPLFQEEEI